jgi:HD-GYP domain-containing protein (c-di-GMP phosphodiesterase class II)
MKNSTKNNYDIGKPTKSDASLQLDAIFRAFPDLLFYMDEKGLIIDYRAGRLSALFVPPQQFLGHSMRDVLPPEIGSQFAHALQESIKTGRVISIEYQLHVPDGENWFEARLVPLKTESRVIAIVRDISERVKNTERIQNQLRRLSALHAVDAAITASFDLKVTLSVILRQMINLLGANAADILVLNQSTHMLEFAAGQGFQTSTPQPMPLMIGQGYAGKAALLRRTISIPDFGNRPVESFLAPDLLREKFANYYAVPLIVKGQVKGVLELYHRSLVRPDDDWLDFLATIAGQSAVAIDSACLFQDLQRTNAELSLAYDSAIESWARVLELSNRESGAHSYRVVDLTVKLARSMGIAEQELNHFRRGALLHDVGKLGIPESILNKPGPLNEAEQKIMQSHPQLAYQMLSSVNYLAPALDIPHYHHERWDGSGYPEGLREDQIPFAARLFAVVDVYDALTSTRPYRSAWSHQIALDHIRENAGKLYDPTVVRAFFKVVRGKP